MLSLRRLQPFIAQSDFHRALLTPNAPRDDIP